MSDFGRRAGQGRRWIGVVCVACLFCLVAVVGYAWRSWRFERRGVTRNRQPADERRPGINVELAQYDAAELDRALSDITSLGFYWVRQRFPWQIIEPERGVCDWERWDALVDAVRRHGLGLIAILDDPPEWATRRGQVPLPCVAPWEEDAFARFAAAFARRYGEVIDHYQIWDEPNLGHSWGGGHVAPCAYAVLLEAAYPAVHAADPSAWVLGGGLAPTQAAGPDDLNDLTYLRQLYAAGGGAYFDILAAKPYGFWSGPGDRRVAPDLLNFSRVVATREWMCARGDGDKPIWAVEWGWNVLPTEPVGWTGEPPPWGSDTLWVQRPRILGAVTRARREWPWMGAMCWAEYQPDIPPSDPRWGFALRNGEGSPTPLYDVLRGAQGLPLALPLGTHAVPKRWMLLAILLSVAGADVFVLWRRCGCVAVLREWWPRWSALRPIWHACALLGLAVLYALTPWPEWMLLELALAAILLCTHPRWALLGAVLTIPFFYLAKPVGAWQVPPSETFLLLAIVVKGVRYAWRKQWPTLAEGPSALDALWALWVAVGALSPPFAPDPPLAWREWRLCMLEPALLYYLLRLERGNELQRHGEHGERSSVSVSSVSPWLWAWVLSGVVVALVGVGQWMVRALVPAGGVARITGVYYSPNHLALYLERIWPLSLALALCSDLERRWRLRAWFAAAVSGVALYLTYSRGAWLLALPAALAVVGWAYRRRLRWWMGFGGAIALFLVVANVFYGRSAAPSGMLDEVRIPVWRSTLAMVADHPWRGVGLDGFRYAYPRYMLPEAWAEPVLYHPHNAWLDAAVRLGLPGLAAFIALVARCLYDARRMVREASGPHKAVAVGLLAGLLAALAHGMVDSAYFLIDLAWSLALVAGTLSSRERCALRSPQRRGYRESSRKPGSHLLGERNKVRH